jgi:hypothetical protein
VLAHCVPATVSVLSLPTEWGSLIPARFLTGEVSRGWTGHLLSPVEVEEALLALLFAGLFAFEIERLYGTGKLLALTVGLASLVSVAWVANQWSADQMGLFAGMQTPMATLPTATGLAAYLMTADARSWMAATGYRAPIWVVGSIYGVGVLACVLNGPGWGLLLPAHLFAAVFGMSWSWLDTRRRSAAHGDSGVVGDAGMIEPVEPSQLSDADLNRRVDGILRRMGDRGEESLQPADRAILAEASRRLRDKKGF